MNTPLPILYIHHERALGGAPLSLLYLLRKLDRQKYSPHVICLREGPAADLFRKDGIPVQVVAGPDLSHTELVWFRWWQWPRLLWRVLASCSLFFRLRRALQGVMPSLGRGANSDILPRHTLPLVHLNSSTLVVGALAARSLGLPVIWHIREPLAPGYIGFRRALLRWAVRSLAGHTISVSHNDAAQLGESLRSDGERLTVVHNFVDLAQFNPVSTNGSVRRELGLPSDALLILFLGGSAHVKGAGVLLAAVPMILGTLRSAHLLIAGDTAVEFRCRLDVTEMVPFRDRVHLLGLRSDIPALLQDSSLLLFPSTVPHFARPVIEAAAMARAVVASDVDGVRELVIPNETAVLVPPNDPESLARAVIELMQDEARASRLGEEGRRWAAEKFDARRNAAATFAVYERVLALDGNGRSGG